MRLIVDAHLDLSMNAMEWNRDLRLPMDEIRAREYRMKDKPDRGKATVSFEALRKGNVGLVVATQIARVVGKGSVLPGWSSPEQAWAHTQSQLAWYQLMQDQGHLRMIKNKRELDSHISDWDGHTIGMILSLEGADSLISLEEFEKAYSYGLRAIGPGHYGPGRYANGTDGSGRLNEAGIQLLKAMEKKGLILDATHLNDDAFWDALDRYSGPIWASHNNCRALVPHNRQFSDEMIKALIQRGAVIGAAFDAWMLVPNWERGKSTPKSTGCTLEKVVDHMDHICQIAGNTQHVGLGTDLDGGFGKEQCPSDLEDISDLQKIFEILSKRGYTAEDCDRMAHGNWLRFLKNALPD